MLLVSAKSSAWLARIGYSSVFGVGSLSIHNKSVLCWLECDELACHSVQLVSSSCR